HRAEMTASRSSHVRAGANMAHRQPGPAKEEAMATELYRDRFGSIAHDPSNGTLVLDWTDETASMTDDEFMAWLARFGDAALSTRAPNLMIDVRRFRASPGD